MNALKSMLVRVLLDDVRSAHWAAELGDGTPKGPDGTPIDPKAPLPADYCGSCFGADPNPAACCNTCEQVREAYRKKGWAFSDPEHIEQVYSCAKL